MIPGAYPNPLVRTTWVQVPMVSGYVGSRLRIADYAFGTSVSGAQGTNVPDNRFRMVVENANNPNAPIASQQGTNIYFRVQQTLDDGPSGTRTPISPEYGVVPGGRVAVADIFINAPFVEIKCTGGGGNIRAQIATLLTWEEMAMDRTDTFGAPQLWNKKFVTMGVIAPSPFPTS